MQIFVNNKSDVKRQVALQVYYKMLPFFNNLMIASSLPSEKEFFIRLTQLERNILSEVPVYYLSLFTKPESIFKTTKPKCNGNVVNISMLRIKALLAGELIKNSFDEMVLNLIKSVYREVVNQHNNIEHPWLVKEVEKCFLANENKIIFKSEKLVFKYNAIRKLVLMIEKTPFEGKAYYISNIVPVLNPNTKTITSFRLV